MSRDEPDYSLLNSTTAETMRLWIEGGYLPGHFVEAVLENNLFEAIARGDKDHLRDLPKLVRWIYNNAPSACHGSPEKVDAWHAKFWGSK